MRLTDYINYLTENVLKHPLISKRLKLEILKIIFNGGKGGAKL